MLTVNVASLQGAMWESAAADSDNRQRAPLQLLPWGLLKRTVARRTGR